MKIGRFIFVILIFCILETSLGACSICATAAADLLFTPIYIWVLFSMGWYLLNSILITVYKAKVWGIPTIAWALLAIIILLFSGAGLLGLGLPLLLLIPLCMISIKVFLGKTDSNRNGNFVRAQKILGGIGLLGLIVLSIVSIYINTTRTPAEYFLQWKGTGPGRLTLERIIRKREAGLADLRDIVRESSREETALMQIDKLFKKSNQPDKDVRYLIKLLDIMQKGYGIDNAMSIEGVLRSLSGLNLKPGTPALDWQKAWEVKEKSASKRRI